MSLLTSSCAIRVANVPEVCVEGKEKEKSRLRAHKRRLEKYAGGEEAGRVVGRL